MLQLHRSARADALVVALAEVLRTPQPDAFAREVVAVPTRGMERWLAQRLSTALGATPGRGDGICANVDFPSLTALVDAVIAEATGWTLEEDPWRPDASAWVLLELLNEHLDEPWLAHLARHLGPDDLRRGRRLGVARHLAEVFDRCSLQRPALVRAWGASLDGGAPWQAEIWRRLRTRLGVPDRAERLFEATARLAVDPGVVDLPSRLSAFGVTRFQAGALEVLRALGVHREVHVHLLHPSATLWSAVEAHLPTAPRPRRRVDDTTARLPANGLLRSWGEDARELQLLLEAESVHHPVLVPPPVTLLARLQQDVRDDRPAPGAPLVAGDPDARSLLSADDRSVVVHACHGRTRQVEVLRDAVLRALEEDRTLQPRDVLVMCPDIEAFAPLIKATFGPGFVAGDDEDAGPELVPEELRPPDLRVRLADRALRQTNPLLGTVARLLELADDRCTASQVLDLADREPVRRRFGLDDEAIEQLEAWAARTGVHWALDAAARAPYGLADITAGTWRHGADRLMAGVAVASEDELVAGVLPLDGTDSGDTLLVGRLAELLDRLRHALAALQGPQPLDAWIAGIRDAADLLTATRERDGWQRDELDHVLAAVLDDAGPSAVALRLGEVRALLAGHLGGRPTRAGFRTGHLTVCSLVPMRSVPHRVICLLGLDDGAFPRAAHRDGDDPLLADPHVGDRDPRAEDRQLLLDALLATEERLIITYTGRDERSNQRRPPCVPVGELLDAIDATVRTHDGTPARAQIVCEQPLQPFDPKAFRKAGELRSFDKVMRDGARALTRRAPAVPFLSEPLDPIARDVVALEDLIAFVCHPVKAFFKQRLGVTARSYEEQVDDALPIELDHLQRWHVGERLVQGLDRGVDLATLAELERARGELPPGPFGEAVLAEVAPQAEAIADALRLSLPAGVTAGSVDVDVPLSDGRTLRGVVPGVRGDVVADASYSKVSPKRRLQAWVRLLALTAACPDVPMRAVLVSRGDPVDRRRLRLPDPSQAVAHLGRLVALHDAGLREPLPLFCKSSAEYVAAVRKGGRADPIAAACKAWTSNEFSPVPGEDRDPEHVLVYGAAAPFGDVLAARPRDDEQGAGWDTAQASRFGRLALRLWHGLDDTVEMRG